MSAGEQHSIVLYEDGSVVVLGYGDHSYNIPSGLWLVMDVAAGREHTAVLDMNLLRMLGTLSVESPDPHNYTMANDISGDGKIIVGSSGRTNSDEAVAVYWDDTGAVHRLEDLLSGIPHNGWEFQTISAVDHDGDSMTGLGIFEGNASQGWHLASSVVPPEEGDLFIEDTSAEDLGDGYHKVSWYGLLKRMENSVHWHVEHGWQFIGRGKADDLTIYDHGLGCWSWTSEKDYPYVYFYCLDSGWTYYKEGGSPGNREYYDFVKGKWIHETELLGGN